MEIPERPQGFICPDWARPFWNPIDCTILKCVGDEYAVVDHNLQSTIFVGTHKECTDWLSPMLPVATRSI